MTVVAVSAAYGAAGSHIGPALADRLGVRFVDRGIALAVAERLDIPFDDALAHDQAKDASLLQRLLSGFLGADTGAPAPLPPDVVSAEDFHQASREVLLAQAATGEGVILGRGAAAALRDDPRVLRVRLTGPVQARIEQALRLGAPDREAAERALRRLDRAHAEYLRQFYDVDVNDPGLYHLTIDATAFAPEVVVNLIEMAVAALPGRGGERAAAGF
ncbi:MAG TPA: cytidylate kinase-like family protein [Solirubrobacteraceae bacterium]|jgi:cytidylate kinase|nr:cytidylate kinase-like family protein [Solirubrobacteraceae bacterium]